MSTHPGPVTLVLGASTRPDRYSHRAILHLLAHGHRVVAVGRSGGIVSGVAIRPDWPMEVPVDTVTVYLNPANQVAWERAILDAVPRRIIFNPGAENPTFMRRAGQAGISTENACTLVLLSTGAY